MMPTAEQHQKDLQRLAQLRPIDDDLMVRQEVAVWIA
jgi:hypothetical protein